MADIDTTRTTLGGYELDAVADAAGTDTVAAPEGAPAPEAVPPAPDAAAPAPTGFINVDEITYTATGTIDVPTLYPTGFDPTNYSWEFGVLAPYSKQRKEGGTDGFVLNTSGGGTFGVPGTGTSLQLGVRQWNFDIMGGFNASPVDTDGDGVPDDTTEVPTLSVGYTKYRVTDGTVDLRFPLYKISAGLVGANQFSGGISTNVPVGPVFVQGGASYTSARSDAEFYFDGFGGKSDFIPDEMVARQTVAVNGAVLMNLSDLKSQQVTKAAVEVSANAEHAWDADIASEDTWNIGAGGTFHFPLWRTDLTLQEIRSDGAPLSLSAAFNYGTGYYVNGWMLPSTGDTTDPFTGLPYDPAYYRGEEELAAVENSSRHLTGTFALGGAIVPAIPIVKKEGLEANVIPTVGMNVDFTGESPVDPFIGASLRITGDGKVKR